MVTRTLFRDIALSSNRPVNLDIGTMRLPITAYVSILHRVSGVAMLVVTSVLLWCLDKSLESPEGFLLIKTIFDDTFAQIVIWGSLSTLGYHMIMGLRHLVMDAGYGETYAFGRVSAATCLVAAVCVICILGFWIFF